MYLGIDVGGSKTLVGVLDTHGIIVESKKFPTPQNYDDFIKELAATLEGFDTKWFLAAGCGIPASRIDRENGVGIVFGNLPWKNVAVAGDIERIAHCPTEIENDAKLACLSEAMLRPNASKVLYVTVSTGIGFAVVQDGKIDTAFGDAGGKTLLVDYNGKMVPWESFASGKAIVERFGKKASEIDDAATWQRIAHDLATGFSQLIALTEPAIVVVGGSVGHYFEKLKPHLETALKQFETPILKMPPLEEAKRPEEAVLYGCYDLVKEIYGKHRQHSLR
jgi:glucokinase